MNNNTPGIIEWSSQEGDKFQLRVNAFYEELGESNFDLIQFNSSNHCFSNITEAAAIELIAALVDRFGFDPHIKAHL